MDHEEYNNLSEKSVHDEQERILAEAKARAYQDEAKDKRRCLEEAARKEEQRRMEEAAKKSCEKK